MKFQRNFTLGLVQLWGNNVYGENGTGCQLTSSMPSEAFFRYILGEDSVGGCLLFNYKHSITHSPGLHPRRLSQKKSHPTSSLSFLSLLLWILSICCSHVFTLVLSIIWLYVKLLVLTLISENILSVSLFADGFYAFVRFVLIFDPGNHFYCV